MKQLIILLLFIPLVSFGQNYSLSQYELGLYNKIISKPEYGSNKKGIRKWNNNLYVYINNPEQKQLVKEFEKIKNEINILSKSVKIARVYKKSEANFTIYFSDRYEYSSKEEVALKYLMNNFGFVWVNWNSRNVIYEGSMYVDISRVKSDECKKHLLREELTQSLGMFNDIEKAGSIFNQNWECITNYSDFDRKVIRKFLSIGNKKDKPVNKNVNNKKSNLEESWINAAKNKFNK